MTTYEAACIMQRELKNCAYELGSTSYQDHCESIKVTYSGNTIYVRVTMIVKDPYYDEEVRQNVVSTVDSIRHQYELNDYGFDIETRCIRG